jgi:hypothetical protein
MGITSANLWRHSFFKSLSSLFSSPTRAINCVIVSETSIVGREQMKLATGYSVKNTLDFKGAWLVIQKLMLTMEGVDGMVLPISERSYIPLDPLGRLTDEDRSKLIPLTQIAKTAYKTAFARVQEENKKSANAKLLETMLYIGGIIAVIVILAVFIRGCGKA